MSWPFRVIDVLSLVTYHLNSDRGKICLVVIIFSNRRNFQKLISAALTWSAVEADGVGVKLGFGIESPLVF